MQIRTPAHGARDRADAAAGARQRRSKKGAEFQQGPVAPLVALPPLRVPADLLEVQKSLLAAIDGQIFESMIFWFGPQGHELSVTDVVRVHQISGPTWVQTTSEGETQLGQFLTGEGRDLQCVGWCHSHHTLQGTPSIVDIENHWRLARYFGPPFMAIQFQRSQSEYADGLGLWRMTDLANEDVPDDGQSRRELGLEQHVAERASGIRLSRFASRVRPRGTYGFHKRQPAS